MPKIIKQYLGDIPIGSASSGEDSLYEIPFEIFSLSKDATSDEIRDIIGGVDSWKSIINHKDKGLAFLTIIPNRAVILIQSVNGGLDSLTFKTQESETMIEVEIGFDEATSSFSTRNGAESRFISLKNDTDPFEVSSLVNELTNSSTSDEISTAIGSELGFDNLHQSVLLKKRIVIQASGAENRIVNVDATYGNNIITLSYDAFGYPGSDGNKKIVSIMKALNGTFMVSISEITYMSSADFKRKGQIPYMPNNDGILAPLEIGNVGDVLSTVDDELNPGTKLPKWVPSYDKEGIENIASQTFNAAKAYADSLVTQYEVKNFYIIDPAKLSDQKPVAAGTEITYSIDTTKKLLGTFTFTLKDNGTSIKDNIYNLLLSFESLSTTRTTYIETIYKIRDVKVFDVETKLNNTLPSFTLERKIESELTADLPYSTGDVITLELWGYISSGTDDFKLVVNDVDRLSGLYRNEPIASLTASLITTTKNGVEMTQQEFNDSIGGGGGGTEAIKIPMNIFLLTLLSTSDDIKTAIGGESNWPIFINGITDNKLFITHLEPQKNITTPVSMYYFPPDNEITFTTLVGQSMKSVNIRNVNGTFFVIEKFDRIILPDVPNDGKMYGRKDQGWFEITSSGGGSTYLLKDSLQYISTSSSSQELSNLIGGQAGWDSIVSAVKNNSIFLMKSDDGTSTLAVSSISNSNPNELIIYLNMARFIVALTLENPTTDTFTCTGREFLVTAVMEDLTTKVDIKEVVEYGYKEYPNELGELTFNSSDTLLVSRTINSGTNWNRTLVSYSYPSTEKTYKNGNYYTFKIVVKGLVIGKAVEAKATAYVDSEVIITGTSELTTVTSVDETIITINAPYSGSQPLISSRNIEIDITLYNKSDVNMTFQVWGTSSFELDEKAKTFIAPPLDGKPYVYKDGKFVRSTEIIVMTTAEYEALTPAQISSDAIYMLE